MDITGKQLIGYATEASGTSSFAKASHNGAPFFEATTSEVDKAVRLASKAFDTYRLVKPPVRAAFLLDIATALADARQLLVETAHGETALPPARLDGEITRTVNQIKLFAALITEGSWVRAIIDTALPDRQPLPKPDVRQMQIALGVVGVFGASNFPFAFSVAGGDTISALAAGCTVVYKAHPGHPATSELVGTIIINTAKQAGMPEGIFSLVQGAGHEGGTTLVQHPLVKAVGFTGSLAGGRALYNAAAKREEPIPVYAEMGSVNPVIILPGILAEKSEQLAKTLAASNTLGVGQFCTNPGLVFTQQSDTASQFIKIFSETIAASAGDTMLTPAISKAYGAGVHTLQSKTGVSLLATGKIADNDRVGVPKAFQTSATAFLLDADLQHEVFGPSSLHVVSKHKDELLQAVRQLQGQLTVSVWGTDADFVEYKDLFDELVLKGGRIICNAVPTGVEVTHAMMHGGPYPATTDSKYTSVGTQAIYRFTRPVCYQGFPQHLLPVELRDPNPSNIWRMVNGAQQQGALKI